MLGPGIGGFELVVVALVALLVVGPKDLPVLMRKVGAFMARARQMASEFRASFDEMARQSELDELRREVEALRTGQVVAAKQEADAAVQEIKGELAYKPAWAPSPTGDAAPRLDTPVPEPEAPPPEAPAEPAPAPGPDAQPAETPRRRRRKAGS